VDITAPASEEAEKWQGWGTALKPAFEPIVMARKPLRKNVVATVLEYGTGALNIESTRTGDRWPANVILDESQAQRLAESKYFYVPKPSKAERPVVDGVAHPTVKPLELMRWLVRLVTPSGGTVLEPFAGSGATVEACILEGFNCIAIEREAEYLPLIQARIDRQDAA
jgi:site-specific DNA-methyltransferase (adenine-specific)